MGKWKHKQPCVYILTNKQNGKLYTGVTSSPAFRIQQHKLDKLDGFSKKHELHRLVYFEMHERMDVAIWREKCIKRWNRQWKINLIHSVNPEWNDLWDELAKETETLLY